MSHFVYIALNISGHEQSGSIDAASFDAAAKALKAQGLFPIEIQIINSPATAATGNRRISGNDRTASADMRATAVAPALAAVGERPRWFATEFRLPFVNAVKPKELAVFTRQLGTLLRAGMPLLRGLEVLGRQEKNRALKRVIETMAEDIRSGGTLSEAMARHPLVFDRLYVNMVRAGEAGGVLDLVLERVAQFQEKSLHLRGKVKAAMVYPLIVMVVAVLILAGLLVFVVPKFRQIFADLLKGAPLPPLTQLVLGASEAVRTHFGLVLVALVGAWFAFRSIKRTPRGARLIDGWMVRVPVFGDLMLKSIVARFARTFGTLLASGVPILQAITITRDTTGNARVAAALDVVHDRVKAGDPVARPLESTQIFPGMVGSMIEVGEHTGKLPEMLGKIADLYEDEVDTAVAGLSSLIEPLLIVFLALVVGTIVVALFLPIIRIVQLLT